METYKPWVKYSDKLIKEYSMGLTNELGKGYSTRSLKNEEVLFISKRATSGCPIDMDTLYNFIAIKRA